MDMIVEKWHALCDWAGPILMKIGGLFKKIGQFLMIVWAYISKLRKVFAAVPIVWAAVILAIRNEANLPATVGISLETDGTFAIEMTRELAVLGPVALTALCLLLMFCSKRILTPWVVSAISLLVPLYIWLINVFPV